VKRISDLSAVDLAGIVQRDPTLARAAAEAKPKGPESWEPDNLLAKSPEFRINEERFLGDQSYANTILEDGRWNAAQAAKAARIAAEEQAVRQEAGPREVEEHLALLDRREAERQATEESRRAAQRLAVVNDFRRSQGKPPLGPDGKPAA
jgi:hypothetical protein